MGRTIKKIAEGTIEVTEEITHKEVQKITKEQLLANKATLEEQLRNINDFLSHFDK